MDLGLLSRPVPQHTVPPLVVPPSPAPRPFITAQLEASTSSLPLRNASPACSICFDPPSEFPILPPTTLCTHRSTVCASCLEQYISHAVLTCGSTAVTCPEVECGRILEYGDVTRGANNDKACLARYKTLLLRRTLQSEPNFVWCKNTACDWGQVHESGAGAPVVICQACCARSCFTHDIPWHTGQTCTQYDAQRVSRAREVQENLASEAYIRQHTKACPNPACGRNIEKNEGCDHMTCPRPVGCGHEFCWVCLADYAPIRNGGNNRHNPSCRYYAPIEHRTTWGYGLLEPLNAPVLRLSRVTLLPPHATPQRQTAGLPPQLHRTPTPPPAPLTSSTRATPMAWPPVSTSASVLAAALISTPPMSWWNWLWGGRINAASAWTE